MLTSQVVAPVAGEFKLLAILDGLLQNIDTLGVRQTHEGFLQHAFKALNQGLVNHLVEEGEIVLTIVERPLHTVLDEVFLQIHQLFLIEESNLGFYHPELGQVAWSI